MLQLHIIADKSEILSQKPRKRQSKNQKQTSATGEHDEYDFTEEEPLTSSSGLSASRKPSRTKQRKIVRTPLDVGTVKALLNQIDLEKYQQAVDWLKECLEDAAEDTEEASEEEDGVPLVPLLELQKEAMEDDDFKKALVALGIQPPVFGMENYWRIPTYLNSADLKLRAKIVAGEEVVVDYDDNDGESEPENNAQHSAGDESEDDYLEMLGVAKERKKLENLESYMDQQREKMKQLLYSKSDDETEERAPLKGKKTTTKIEKQKKKKMDDSSEEDVELVNQIKHKLDKKKRNYDLSSDEDENDDNDIFTKSQDLELLKTSTSDLFDQLKAKRAESKINNDASVTKDDDIDVNFNSEDFRKRLAELSDNDDGGDGDGDGDKQTSINRSRRVNVIESDTDDDNGNEKGDENQDGVVVNAVDNVNKANNRNQQTLNDDNDDADADDNNEFVNKNVDDGVESIKKQKQSGDNIMVERAQTLTKKRQRSPDAGNINKNDVEEEKDEDAGFLKRKKPSPSKQRSLETNEEPAKRRRFNIIDDDDEDD